MHGDLRRLLVVTGIVLGIDEVELQRRGSVYLNNGFAAGHRVVMHVRVEEGKAAGGKGSRLGGVENIAHTESESPGDDSNVFTQRVEVWSDAVSVGHLEAHGVVAGRGRRIALEHCKLRTLREKWRGRTPWNRVWGEGVSLVSVGLRGDGEELAGTAEQDHDSDGEIQVAFHSASKLIRIRKASWRAGRGLPIEPRYRLYIFRISAQVAELRR